MAPRSTRGRRTHRQHRPTPPPWHFRQRSKTPPIDFGADVVWVHCACGRLFYGDRAEQQFAWHQAHPQDEEPAPARADRAREWIEALPERVGRLLTRIRRGIEASADRVRTAPSPRKAAAELGALATGAAAVAVLAFDALVHGDPGHAVRSHRLVTRNPDETYSTEWHGETLHVERHGRWWRYYRADGSLFRKMPVLTGAATIVGSVAGGNWNTNGAWVGGVQPAAADDVTLTATTGNITIPSATTALCRSLDCTGYTGTLTWSATTSTLNVGDASGGAVKFVAGMTVTLTGVGGITLVSTSNNGGTGWAFTSAGKNMPNITTNGNGGKWVQQDAITSPGSLSVTRGEWVTNNQSLTLTGRLTSDGVLTRTMTLGSSAISLASGAVNAVSVNSTTNLTMTANTAVITLTGGTAGVAASGLNFNGTSFVHTGAGNFTVGASGFTCANVTRTGTNVKTDGVTLNGNLTCTGTLTLTPNSLTNRLLVASATAGTPWTITAAVLVCTNVVDFMDITGAGAATWTTGASGATAFGDCGGNSGITFTAATTRYGVVAGNWSSTATWSAASGGAGGASVPLPQDTVVLDASSAAGTYSGDMPRLGADIICTGFTRTLNVASVANQATSIFGSLTLSSGLTLSGSIGATINMRGRSSHTITSAGKTFAFTSANNVSIIAPGGTYTLQDAMVQTHANTGATANISAGTFDSNGQSVTLGGWVGNAGTTTTMGSSTWSLTSTGAIVTWNFSPSATLNGSASTITFTGASTNSRTFAGGGKTYGTLTYTVAGSTGALVVTGANTFATINFSDASNARTLTLPSSTTTTITSSFNVNGTAGNLMTVNSSTSGTAATLSKSSGLVFCTYVSLKDSAATGGASFYYDVNSNVVSGVTGWGLGVQGTQATTTTTANAGSASVAVNGTQATTTSTANGGSASVSAAGTSAVETDTANAGAPRGLVAGTMATETDSASSGAATATHTGSQATETDTPAGGTIHVDVAGSQATETDTANAGAATGTHVGAMALEVDTAAAGALVASISGGQALEVDTAFAGTLHFEVPITWKTFEGTGRAVSLDEGVMRAAGLDEGVLVADDRKEGAST